MIKFLVTIEAYDLENYNGFPFAKRIFEFDKLPTGADNFTRHAIEITLDKKNNNKLQSARLLGINRNTLAKYVMEPAFVCSNSHALLAKGT